MVVVEKAFVEQLPTVRGSSAWPRGKNLICDPERPPMSASISGTLGGHMHLVGKWYKSGGDTTIDQAAAMGFRPSVSASLNPLYAPFHGKLPDGNRDTLDQYLLVLSEKLRRGAEEASKLVDGLYTHHNWHKIHVVGTTQTSWWLVKQGGIAHPRTVARTLGKTAMEISRREENALFATAAIELLHRPDHPAHFAFWAEDRRESTLKWCQQTADAKIGPAIIRHSLLPFGIHDTERALRELRDAQAPYIPKEQCPQATPHKRPSAARSEAGTVAKRPKSTRLSVKAVADTSRAEEKTDGEAGILSIEAENKMDVGDEPVGPATPVTDSAPRLASTNKAPGKKGAKASRTKTARAKAPAKGQQRRGTNKKAAAASTLAIPPAPEVSRTSPGTIRIPAPRAPEFRFTLTAPLTPEAGISHSVSPTTTAVEIPSAGVTRVNTPASDVVTKEAKLELIDEDEIVVDITTASDAAPVSTAPKPAPKTKGSRKGKTTKKAASVGTRTSTRRSTRKA
ncbi:uncharacterized protein BXZ73DRAFT_105445 [Epithele typhae]|uniref:uncharacterized protein n=1 Tax=Epithele typhae TaxID=378194 RepID=UPI00200749BA|nr:uncharacterized protein BXZ73DRAFT_105445 [Epithele typhae]KAH9917925.1 hypothetical protein BXZ73DRAFT_105445 [Epithele typhae]